MSMAWGRDVAGARLAVRRMAEHLRLDEVTDRLRNRDTHEVIERARAVMAGSFSFTKTWDMERCSVVYPFDGSNWNVVNHDDEEWCFMLNRMDYLEDLALAFVVSGEQRFARHAADLIDSWIAAHPTIEEELSTRTLDTGIRVRTISCVLPVLDKAGVLDDELLARVLASLSDQVTSLRKRYLPKYETSNWGSIQTLAVLTTLAVLCPNASEQDDWTWAQERAASQMRAQVYPDGIDWEQSTMYHVEVLLSLLRPVSYLQAVGLPVPQELPKAAQSLAQGLCAQMLPGGYIDAQGDSDRVDVQGLLRLCAGVLKEPSWARVAGGEHLEPLDLLAFGCDVEDDLAALDTAASLPPRCFDGMDSGLMVARSSWDSRANVTIFSSGPLGSGHGHSDNLHLTVVSGGAPVLIDSGRYTYREDAPLRPELKGPFAHNAPFIDDRSNCAPKGSWGYYDFSYPLKPYVRHTEQAHYFEGALIGHDPLQVLVRKVVALDTGIWVIADEAFADGSHTLTSRLRFDPEAAIELHESGEQTYRASVASGELCVAATGRAEQSRGVCSLDYNQLSDQAVLDFSQDFVDRGSLVWWMAPASASVVQVPVYRAKTEAVDSSLAQAFRVSVASDEFWTVVFFHAEVFSGVKAFWCEDVAFHAKTVLIHGTGDTRELTVLRA